MPPVEKHEAPAKVTAKDSPPPPPPPKKEAPPPKHDEAAIKKMDEEKKVVSEKEAQKAEEAKAKKEAKDEAKANGYANDKQYKSATSAYDKVMAQVHRVNDSFSSKGQTEMLIAIGAGILFALLMLCICCNCKK